MDQPILPDFSKGNGLLPAIAQDVETGRVLMLAWMNEESFRQTVATSQAVYFSRSRKALWRKGEQSGHTQAIVAIHVDCDGDAILLRVKQRGAACHDGYFSCFYRQLMEETWEKKWRVVGEPIVDLPTVDRGDADRGNPSSE